MCQMHTKKGVLPFFEAFVVVLSTSDRRKFTRINNKEIGRSNIVI